MRTRLLELKLDFHERTVPSLGLHQVFLQDPAGVTIELNYPADDEEKEGRPAQAR
jgi:hypothetical protein